MAIVSFNFIPWVTSAAKTIGYDAIKADQLIWESVKENFPNIIEGINQCSENYIEQFRQALCDQLRVDLHFDVRECDSSNDYIGTTLINAYTVEFRCPDNIRLEDLKNTILEILDNDGYVISTTKGIRIPKNGTYDEYETKIGLKFWPKGNLCEC